MSNYVNFSVYVDLDATNLRRVKQTVTPSEPYGVHIRTSAANGVAAIGKLIGPQEMYVFPETVNGDFVMVEVEGNLGWLNRTLVNIPDWNEDKGTILENVHEEPAGKKSGRPSKKQGEELVASNTPVE